MRLIVFDLDHTLLSVNSSFRFGFYLYQQKFFPFYHLVLSLLDYVRHKYCFLSIHELHAKSFFRLFKGRFYEEVKSHVNQFLSNELSSLLNPRVVNRLKESQNRGDYVMILSSSPDFLVSEVSRHLKIQDWKATQYFVDQEGKFEKISLVMEGKKKAEFIVSLAQQLQLPLSALTVYSDSYLDLPLLQLAGEPIGVMPDRHLRKICYHRGWEILNA